MGAHFLCHLYLRTACKRIVGKPAFQLTRVINSARQNCGLAVKDRSGHAGIYAMLQRLAGGYVFLYPPLGDARVHLTRSGPPLTLRQMLCPSLRIPSLTPLS